MKRALFEIWEEPSDVNLLWWRVQLVNYIGHFESKDAAERFVATTKKAREQDAKAVTSGKTAQQNRRS